MCIRDRAHSVDLDQKLLTCQNLFKEKDFYTIPYDHLVIACGSKTSTFNTPGVAERELSGTGEVCFLKHLYHAKMIRNRVLECFERASVPGILPQERNRLLSFVVVGGGPTSCEFTGELHDFVISDVACWYPELKPHITIHLLEAGSSLLGSFDESLRAYLERSLSNRSIDVRTGAAVTEVSERAAADGWYNPEVYCKLSDGSEIPFGCLVWSAGLQPVKFVQQLDLPKGPGGRIVVDKYMRVQGQGSAVFALGDCASDSKEPMVPLAKVAEQQGKYLAASINQVYLSLIHI
eukprot:TRINITY_DN38333_c0_g1_i2.p1 TRINITY_DN38333_c0_g1~~TRINITY_DN38333_c0_g1_i2.p1  ORF type:complete len:292 (-),score=88.93 TRINITY_DN38333_c0_g1_i2:162-1037(-)